MVHSRFRGGHMRTYGDVCKMTRCPQTRDAARVYLEYTTLMWRLLSNNLEISTGRLLISPRLVDRCIQLGPTDCTVQLLTTSFGSCRIAQEH